MSADTVRRGADERGTAEGDAGIGGQAFVDGADLARLAVELAGEQGERTTPGQSARNRFQGIVTPGDQRRCGGAVERCSQGPTALWH